MNKNCCFCGKPIHFWQAMDKIGKNKAHHGCAENAKADEEE